MFFINQALHKVQLWRVVLTSKAVYSRGDDKLRRTYLRRIFHIKQKEVAQGSAKWSRKDLRVANFNCS